MKEITLAFQEEFYRFRRTESHKGRQNSRFMIHSAFPFVFDTVYFRDLIENRACISRCPAVTRRMHCGAILLLRTYSRRDLVIE